MKNISLLFTVFLVLQITTLAQDGWFQQTSGTTEPFRSVYFVDVNTGWAVGGAGKFNTTDGGENWNIQSLEGAHDVFFINSNIGWVTLDPPGLLKTTNGGIEWIAKPIQCVELGSVFFIDDNIGWVVGFGGFSCSDIIQKTTDGGESWTELQEAEGSALCFINSNIGWYAYYGTDFGSPGSIHKTTDGGLTFVQQLGDTISLLSDICFTDQNNGWVTSRYGYVLHTTNGGESWEEQTSGWEPLTSVDFVDESFGWIVGQSGTIINTTNGGTDWYEQESGVTEALTSVSFTSSNTGWAVGTGGTILHTTNGGVSFVEEYEVGGNPIEFDLTQNYPNPFNPSTKIKYSVPQSSQVQIKVFDVLGNEIETLVNQEKPAGTYEITWYAEALPSGIYFYQLKVYPANGGASSFVETKKMILLR